MFIVLPDTSAITSEQAAPYSMPHAMLCHTGKTQLELDRQPGSTRDGDGDQIEIQC
jgi:hypothetical protein